MLLHRLRCCMPVAARNVLALNAPYNGDTQLPNITVLTLGSRPPLSRRIEEEGFRQPAAERVTL